ncbi:MAG: bifunctional oligoribonuclease/PAP phosphatase NrnA [Candidatus Omnitrophota bacterium]
MVPKRLVEELLKKEHKVFVVSAHIHLEGDALGAELAVASLLRQLGKKVLVVNDDDPPEEYLFLPGVRTIRKARTYPAYDAAVLVDCSDASRIGKLKQGLKAGKPLINIDHHVSNGRFGSVNWVEPKASSACEMIYTLFRALKKPIGRKEAILLYTGLLSDTGSFRYASTTAYTHEAAADLMKHGIDIHGINQKLYENFSFETMKAIGRVAGNMRKDPTGAVAWVEVPVSLLRKYPALEQQTDELIRFTRAVKGAEAALLFKEVAKGEVRVNLRSRGRLDVNKLAQTFGGGGHPKASGCTLKGSLKGVVAKVVAAAVSAAGRRA